jgi:hypothetical protein
MEFVSGLNLIADGLPIEADSARSWKKVKQLQVAPAVFHETGREPTGIHPQLHAPPGASGA